MRRKPLGFEDPNFWELLYEINKDLDQKPLVSGYYPVRMLYAMRAVVELHKPITASDELVVCKANCEGEYPCPTIQTIMEEVK